MSVDEHGMPSPDDVPEARTEGVEQAPEDRGPELPGFASRIVQTFFSPGAVMEALARNPAWAAALLLGAALVLTQTLLIPTDVWQASFREAMVSQGREIPEGFAAGGSIMRISAVVMGTVMYAVMAFILAGVVTVIFAFVMGDDGRYTQYLAATAHAWLIPAVVGLALVPLRISQENPQFTLNLGSFLFFLPEGYLTRLGNMLDLSQAWAWLVVAQGAHAIDRRRSFGSAAAVLMVLFLAMAMLFALLPGTG